MTDTGYETFPKTRRPVWFDRLPLDLCLRLRSKGLVDFSFGLRQERVLEDHADLHTVWFFTCTFQTGKKEHRRGFTWPLDAVVDCPDFEAIVFRHHHPRQMWLDALELNDNIMWRSLAAFCWACCAMQNNYTAWPRLAFIEGGAPAVNQRGKHEVID